MSYQSRAERQRRAQRCYICPSYTECTAVLPDEGERLVFGVHRQHRPEAESARAWPSIRSHSSRLIAAADRRADKAIRNVEKRGIRTVRSHELPYTPSQLFARNYPDRQRAS